MESKNKGDLTINGFGSSNGGEFHHVFLNGKGTINTDITCIDFECNGSGSVNGSLTSKTAKISGNGKIAGNVNSSSLVIEGRAKIEKDIVVTKMKVSGHTSIGGSLKGEELKVKGRLKVDGDCEVDLFKGECHFTIGGLLNAEEVDVTLYGDCKTKEIGGQSIKVKQKSSFVSSLFKPFFQNELNTDLIEGDHIEIENTHAKVVRGNHIMVGPNCHIGLIEYSGTLKIDKKAIIDESKKI
ncbi:MAG: polymer-forming cytoskeletal protein [Bacillota bacterium]|nr:polymer-forming cytoskeletal protein [Bacillota bacterium]